MNGLNQSLQYHLRTSRLGIYRHGGMSGIHVSLHELIPSRVTCHAASGYRGKPGELWLARVLPPPFSDYAQGYSFVSGAPYLLGRMANGGYSGATMATANGMPYQVHPGL